MKPSLQRQEKMRSKEPPHDREPFNRLELPGDQGRLVQPLVRRQRFQAARRLPKLA
jgi:hypothetical protein